MLAVRLAGARGEEQRGAGQPAWIGLPDEHGAELDSDMDLMAAGKKGKDDIEQDNLSRSNREP